MSAPPDDPEVLRRALARERAARREAEHLLESKARELYEARLEQERLRADAEAQAEQLRSLSAAVPDLLFAMRADGTISASPQRGSMDEAELGRHATPRLAAAVTRALEGGAVERIEYALGPGQRFEARVSRMTDAEATVLVRDVTLERRAEAELRAREATAVVRREGAERTLADALAAVQAGLWEFDAATGQHWWSSETYALLGYAPGEIEPSLEALRARVEPDDFARLMTAPEPAQRVVEYRIRLPEGGVRWCRDVIRIERDPEGAVICRRGIITDVTGERLNQRQLARLAEVANRTDNPVVITDLDVRIEWVNAAFTAKTGYTLDEVRGHTPGRILQGPHTDRAAVAHMRAAIAARAPFDCEVLNYAKSGSQYWVQISSRVALDDRGEPLGFIAVQTDTTARRLAEQADKVAARVAALLLASDSLESAADALTRSLVRELDVRVAQLWRIPPGTDELQYVAGAAAEATGAAGEAFVQLSRGLAFRVSPDAEIGTGIPGAAASARTPFVQMELAQAGSRRADAGLAADIQTVCAAPILSPTGVLGVIELGGSRFYPGHEQLPRLLQRVAEQVAAFMLHDNSRHAFRSVFELGPDALLLLDDAGTVSAANARAVTLFGPVSGTRASALFNDGAALHLPGPEGSGAAEMLEQRARGAAGEFWAEVSVAATPTAGTQAAILAIRDLTERRRIEAALTESLREKDTLLREVHHRVKNNLQIVSSLLSLQVDGMIDAQARAALDDTVLRVRSMALVHQQLYNSTRMASIRLGDYASSLCLQLQGALAPRAQLRVHSEPVEVEVEVDVAVPCGLILNELVTNAIKHGCGSDGSCQIDVTVRPTDAGFELVVTDRGPGFAADALAPAVARSLGMTLVRTLARQLRARLTFGSDGGARVTVEVPRSRTETTGDGRLPA